MIDTANNLNQYTQRTLSGKVHLGGTAAADATVTINRPSISGITVEPVTRQGSYFHKKFALDNSSGADVEEIAVVGVKAGAHSTSSGQVDIVSTYSGVVWAVQSPEQFTYDADGNMLSDALRKYEWDAENRLIAVTASNVVDGSLTRVEFAYDYMSRRSSKTVYNWISNNWSEIENRKFIYDGWNPVKEICAATGKGTITDYYVWGLDLSGSLQGAGGIGGLLARYRSEQRYYDEQGMLLICHRPPGNPENEQTLRINESAWPAHQTHGDTLGACAGGSVSNSAFLYTYDGNGNVFELLNPKSAIENRQFIVAHYEYSPFGETIVSTGPEAQDNPFRFSTKYFDAETGLSYYGLRYYSPNLGRFLSTDPMPLTEIDFNHSYRFVENRPTTGIDFLGLGTCCGMSFTPSAATHGTIERYHPPPWFWPWSNYEQLTASRGSPASATWGEVAFNYSDPNSIFSASVSAATDFSQVPSDTTLLFASVTVHGKVTVTACCKKVDISWKAEGKQDLGRTSRVQIGPLTPFMTSAADKSFSKTGTFTLDIGSDGTATFNVLVETVWSDAPPSTILQTGGASLSATTACRYN